MRVAGVKAQEQEGTGVPGAGAGACPTPITSQKLRCSGSKTRVWLRQVRHTGPQSVIPPGPLFHSYSVYCELT